MLRIVTLVILSITLFAGSAFAESKISGTMNTTQYKQYLTQNKGKVLVINIFASWCPPCQMETPHFINQRSAQKASDVNFIGISVDDDLDDLHAFMAEHGFNFPVYHATTDLSQYLGITAIPETYIYKANGVLSEQISGAIDENYLKQSINAAKK